jgi:hypothetical protein
MLSLMVSITLQAALATNTHVAEGLALGQSGTSNAVRSVIIFSIFSISVSHLFNVLVS